MAGVRSVDDKHVPPVEPEKLSSPKSHSNNPSSGIRTPLHQEPAEVAYLVIRKQPSHVFWHETFKVEFALETPGSPDSSPPSNVEIRASLEKRGPGSLATSSLVVIEEPRLSPSRLVGTLVCKIVPGESVASIAATTSRVQNGSYCIRLDARGNQDINGVMTDSIAIVQSKLRVQPSEDFSSVWFKDEGGREKSLEVTVTCHDAADQMAGETIELLVKLCYDAANGGPPVPVMNQGILRLLGSDRSLIINKLTGQTKIRYRVEDVSKNHQGQSFVLSISAKERTDIAPCCTPPVTIRSKRNKRHRATAASTSGGGTAASTPMAYSTPAGSSHQGPPYSDPHSQRSASLDAHDMVRLREAVQAIVRWSDEVVNGIYPLQWQVMGYAHNPDGSLDYNRPYHNMHNPNPFISRILAMYNESTRDHLHVLRRAVEQTGTPSMYPPRGASEGSMYEPMQRDSYSSGMMPPQGVYGPMGPGPMQGGGMPPFMTGGMPPPPPQMLGGSGGGGAGGMPPNLGAPPKPGDYATGGYYQGMSSQQQQQQQPQTAGGSTSPHPGSYASGPPHSSTRQAAARHPGDPGSSPSPKPVSDRVPTATADVEEDYNEEANVEYVLARQFKAFQTGEKLGFPAYSASKDILGFYRESDTRVGVRHFVPIRQHAAYFGPAEYRQATDILEEAIAQKNKAVHSLKEWGSIVSLLDHALVYDWSKDIGADIGGSSGGGNSNPSMPSGNSGGDM